VVEVVVGAVVVVVELVEVVVLLGDGPAGVGT
jgi:hypothetical protein